MSKLTWKLQYKFVDKVLKGDRLFWDFSQKDEIYIFGDSFHFYVIPMTDVFIDILKIQNYMGHRNNLTRVKLIDEYNKMDFCSNVCWTVEQWTKDKGTLRKFEYLDKHLWINETYLKEFDFFKNPESFCIGADPVDGFKKPVMFESEDLTVVILPVRVGDENGRR